MATNLQRVTVGDRATCVYQKPLMMWLFETHVVFNVSLGESDGYLEQISSCLSYLKLLCPEQAILRLQGS